MSLRRYRSALARPMAPVADGFSAQFWDALSEGRFLLAKCTACGKLQFPPRPQCPSCHSDAIAWVESAGRGRLYTRTRVHAAGGPFACMTPYSVGIVDLDEGVRVLTRLLHDASGLAPDAAVQLVIVDHTDGPLFCAAAAG